jgi:hypothetical protein
MVRKRQQKRYKPKKYEGIPTDKGHHKSVAFYMVALAALSLFLVLPSYLSTTGAVTGRGIEADRGAVILTTLLIVIIVFILLIAAAEASEKKKRR